MPTDVSHGVSPEQPLTRAEPWRGRPLSESAAWKRVLDAEPPANIDEAIDLARLVRRRSRNERIRILPALDGRIDDDPRVQHGGAHPAIHHGAGIGQPNQRDIYISAADADSFRADFRATLLMCAAQNPLLEQMATATTKKDRKRLTAARRGFHDDAHPNWSDGGNRNDLNTVFELLLD